MSHTYVEKGDSREHVLKVRRIHMNMCGYILNPFFQAEYAGSVTERATGGASDQVLPGRLVKPKQRRLRNLMLLRFALQYQVLASKETIKGFRIIDGNTADVLVREHCPELFVIIDRRTA